MLPWRLLHLDRAVTPWLDRTVLLSACTEMGLGMASGFLYVLQAPLMAFRAVPRISGGDEDGTFLRR